MPKGTTSKETVETKSYGKKLYFVVKFPEFLGSSMYIFCVCFVFLEYALYCRQWQI